MWCSECGELVAECVCEPRVEMRCQMCGESIAVDEMGLPQLGEEVGEFIDPIQGKSVYGHASCGLERELELA